jgi:adenosylcobinamide kinase / adenosylcobinamide-phosphate guanylyltransferase
VGKLILVLGGARSGKSTFAQSLAHELAGPDVLFVATAEAGDEEMRARIAVHRRDRPAGWRTLEAPLGVGQSLATEAGARVVLIDCLTLLVSNVMLAQGEEADPDQAETAVLAEVEAIWNACSQSQATYIVVSNEVGLGLVPAYPLGRLYRDLLGRANQLLAARADTVYFMLAGLPMALKPASNLSHGNA